MTGDRLYMPIGMGSYVILVILTGLYYVKHTLKNGSNYFLGTGCVWSRIIASAH